MKPMPFAMASLRLAIALAPCAAAAQGTADSVAFTLRAKVRDFQELHSIDTVPGMRSHPDFQNDLYRSSFPINGMISPTLEPPADTDGGPDGYPGDARDPILNPEIFQRPVGYMRPYTSPGDFAEWYRDVPGVNRPFYADLPFTLDSAGAYHFGSSAHGVMGDYYPLDFPRSPEHPGGYYPIHPGDPGPLGAQQRDFAGERLPHDYGFTTELHCHFRFRRGAHQELRVTGDDDIWVFVNGRLAVEMAGIHQPTFQAVSLDSLRDTLGLADGGLYIVDLFSAERYILGSNLEIQATFPLVPGLPTTTVSLAGPADRPREGGRGWLPVTCSRPSRRLDGRRARSWVTFPIPRPADRP